MMFELRVLNGQRQGAALPLFGEQWSIGAHPDADLMLNDPGIAEQHARLGVLLAMPFWMFESVGALLDNQRGALAGGQLNPSLGPDATPVGHLFKQLVIYLLIAVLGLSVLMQVIWDSYRIWPATAWIPLPAVNGFGVFLGILGDTFTHMMLYAAPFIAVLLFMEFGIALLGVYSQQLQVSTLAPPVKCLAGIGILLLYFALLQDLMVGRLNLLSDLKHSLGLMFQVSTP